MKRKSLRAVSGAFMVLFMQACTQGPNGLIGVNWDMTGNAAAEKLAIQCDTWTPWAGAQGFEDCADRNKRVWNRPASTITLTRHDGKLAGVSIGFDVCNSDQLRQTVIHELSLDPEARDYWSWSNGKLVRFHERQRGYCQLIVTNEAFGRSYAKWSSATDFPNLWH